MLRHIVLVDFRQDLADAVIQEAIAGILALARRIDGIREITSGANVSTEALGHGFRYGFVIDFVDAAARDAYLVHPDHVTAGRRLAAAAAGGLAGVLVFDYPLNGGRPVGGGAAR